MHTDDTQSDAVRPEGGLSRRDVIRRAGIVGGTTLVATPLIQTITAPAASASVGPIPTGVVLTWSSPNLVKNASYVLTLYVKDNLGNPISTGSATISQTGATVDEAVKPTGVIPAKTPSAGQVQLHVNNPGGSGQKTVTFNASYTGTLGTATAPTLTYNPT